MAHLTIRNAHPLLFHEITCSASDFPRSPAFVHSRLAYESAILRKDKFLAQGGLRNEIFKPLSFFIRGHIVTYPTLTSSSPQESARIVMTMIDCHVTSLSRAAGAVIHIDVACMVMADGPNSPGMIQSNQVSRIEHNPLSHSSHAFLCPFGNLTSVQWAGTKRTLHLCVSLYLL
jgi:hypothetical protein